MSILFQNQWKNKEGKLRAIPHLNTTNTSFLRTAQLLKKMGIKNYAFPLCLYDPDLKDVNVHDLEDNTPENENLRRKVIIEARKNVWYYLRECVRIYSQGGEPVPFRLDRASTAMTWCFLNGIDYCGMAPRQTGKSSTLDSLVRTPNGWVRMGDLKLNDEIITPDGGVANIVGVYPQGKIPCYRVYFEDGRWADCSEDHLWKVHWPHWGEQGGGKWRVITLREIVDHMESHKKSNNCLSVPLIEPERKADIDLPIDPYVLGVILGDGSIYDNRVTICKPDDWLRLEVGKLLPEGYTVSEYYGDNKSFSIQRDGTKDVPNFATLLHDLGLKGTLSHTKFIPDIYMNASASQRWSLIQGLMDTDGTVETPRMCKDGVTPKHGAVEYSTTSLKMAHQVQEIFRSLGGLCKLSERQTYYTHNGEKRKGRLSFRVNPRMKNRTQLFRLPRKKDLTTIGDHKYQDNLKLAIKSVEYIGEHEAQCIEVDHPDHLYITDDYIVTHNTVCALSLTSWIMYSSGYEFVVGLFTKDDKLRQENVKRVRSFGENLPSWWLAEDRNKDKKNTTEIFYDAFRTHYVTMVAQKDKSAADLQARGASMPVLHIDELEYCASIDVSYPTMLASTGTARENAKFHGKPHSNIITTTAGDPSKPECKAAAKILEGAMPFTEHLYDLENNDKLHEVVEASSPQKMIIGVFSHLQLGYDNKWLRDKIARNKMTRDQVMRDYLNRRVSIQEDPIIPQETLALITASEREPAHIQILSNKFVIYWYLPEEEVQSPQFRDRPIVVGCDSSEMIGRDATTLVGVDPRDLSTVFTFKCNEGNINIVGTMIAQLLMMFPKMVWVPENKSSGTSLIDIVTLILRKEGHNPFVRIFNWVVNNKNEVEFQKYDIRDMNLLDTSVKRYFGIKTDKTKRDELYSAILLEAASKAASRIKDKILIKELSSLTVRNGRVDHEVGGNDDTVIGWLMAIWLILRGRNLQMYGLKPGTVLSHVSPGRPDKTQLSIERQEKVRSKLDELEKQLRLQQDPSLRRLLASDIELLKEMLESGPIATPTTSDELYRDPRRYTDPVVAEKSRDPVSVEDMEKSLKMVLGMSGR